MIKLKDFAEVIEYISTSKTNARITAYILKNLDKYNIITKNSSSEPVTAKYLSKYLKVSERTINSYFKEARSIDFIRKVGGVFRVDPFIIVPYSQNEKSSINDQIAAQLQKHWLLNDNTIPSIILLDDTILEKQALEDAIKGINND